MNDWRKTIGVVVVTVALGGGVAKAGVYRVLPSEDDVLPGATTTLRIEVETETGDNTVGFGYFSFAIDLSVSGTAGATGSDISGILINETFFDDLTTLGLPEGDRYVGVAGVTSDIFPPTFGHNPGDITWLFTFDMAIPASAMLGDNITITPSEGSLDNLIANPTFDNVTPQTFRPATLTIIPEPSTLTLLGLAAATAGVARRRRAGLRDRG